MHRYMTYTAARTIGRVLDEVGFSQRFASEALHEVARGISALVRSMIVRLGGASTTGSTGSRGNRW